MKTVTPTELRGNIYQLLEDVLDSGVPLEINKGGELLRIIPVKKALKLDNLPLRPEVVNGEPDDLANLHWDKDVNLDLP